MRAIVSAGGQVALPVIVGRARPLLYRAWRPGVPMAKGPWGIPYPQSGATLQPDCVLAPLLGFDGQRYRLGFGGGLFDRTLAAAVPRPRAIGVGYACGGLATIRPQPHDIAMDLIVTEDGVRD